MRLFGFVLILLGVFAALALADQDSDTRKAILGHDPVFDATIGTSPLNLFLKRVFRPEETIEERSGLQVPYEEAIPYGSYYPNEGHYYEQPAYHAPSAAPKGEEKLYYQDGGLYYPAPEEEEKK
ncbi:MAG: hypothetical protein ABH845_02865 [Candidatus Omnitrophota bacterium]